ncbi:MAG: ABC transporter ATP-binding protein [Actinomycetota bacterium]|nr:ABC transporter ATP-binding protein [Actinomycetota bacterium]
MSSDLSIRVSGLSKSYRLRHSPDRADTLVGQAVQKLRHPLASRSTRDDFLALDDVSFDIRPGDVLGIVGRNGAGKSTLLKVLTRITYPSSGRVDIWGRVGSLLEVGTGFHPDLTGRENIYLNGSTLGMTSREVRARFEEIVDFAGVEQFLDTPVKRYSSGMYVRLAFAVAAHLEADILLVDEVLAVGDAEFQERCLGKMRDVAGTGRTVILVSHQLQSVRALCTRGIVLQKGQVTFDGGSEAAVRAHLASYEELSHLHAVPESRPGSGLVRARSAQPAHPSFAVEETKTFHISIDALGYSGSQYYLGLHLLNEDGIEILQLDSRLVGWWGSDRARSDVEVRISSPWLKPGRYRVDVFVCGTGQGVFDEWEGACFFRVDPVLPYAHSNTPDGNARGVVFAQYEIESRECRP